VVPAKLLAVLPSVRVTSSSSCVEPLLLDDAVEDPRFASDPALTSAAHRSMLLVPILKLGELRALLVLQNRLRRGAFSAGRLDAVSMIAGQLTVSLDNALLYASMERKVAERTAALEEANRQLEQLSITDPLTGIANHRRFTQMLRSEWQRARRTGSPIGLAMVDVDQFKLYNDHHGHPSGDAVLRRVAGTLADGLRLVGDLAARYGGEEFVLVLPNTDLAGIYSVCDRLRREIEALAEPHPQSTHGVVTVSIGIVAFVPTNDATPAQYIEAADARLYEAKRRGRNRVWGRAEDLAGS
jgi:diguanylate cyclase (GGDEF)-like protein